MHAPYESGLRHSSNGRDLLDVPLDFCFPVSGSEINDLALTSSCEIQDLYAPRLHPHTKSFRGGGMAAGRNRTDARGKYNQNRRGCEDPPPRPASSHLIAGEVVLDNALFA